jgi:hypothetical protein
MSIDPYAELRRVLDLAVAQAAEGKGKERHVLGDEPFELQPIVRIGKRQGSNHFALGQAQKKAEECLRLPPDRQRAEILGAINYLAAAYLLVSPSEEPADVAATQRRCTYAQGPLRCCRPEHSDADHFMAWDGRR